MKLSKEMLLGGLKDLPGLLPFLLAHTSDANCPIRNASAWGEEKEDILARANYLYKKIITSPKQLLSEMPNILGEELGGQWAIYSCTMYASALVNIARLYPETRERSVPIVKHLVDMVNTPEIRNYDTIMYHEDALATLHTNHSHMTYLSLLAWTISNYKFIGGGNEYDALYTACCEAMHRRMLKRSDLCLPSFPNGIVFLPDMLFAIVALHNYRLFFDDRFEPIVHDWLDKAQHEWLHQPTGLLYALMCSRGRSNKSVRGSYAALSCYCLTLLDCDHFAQTQYLLMKKHLQRKANVFGYEVIGIREYRKQMPKFKLDYDAGPIVDGLSPSGTAFALGAATYFQDWEFRSQLLRTAEIAGKTKYGEVQNSHKEAQSTATDEKKVCRECHYRLGEIALVGEATALAMRTNANIRTF